MSEASQQNQCLHSRVQVEPSPYAEEAGFERQSLARRLAATTKSGRCSAQNLAKVREKTADNDLDLSFPAPLVLPDDDLAWDPKSPPQSFRAWLYGETRNRPTEDRQTLYVAAAPQITTEVAFMGDWLRPDIDSVRGKSARPKAKKMSRSQSPTIRHPSPPSCEDVISYLSAFYHGMPVKPLPQRLHFVPWEDEEEETEKRPKKKKQKQKTNNGERNNKPKFIGLATPDDNSATRIRVRPAPDGVFQGQLNLDDILDAAIEMLPQVPDAYALLLLVDHDLYEDEEDDFCCGRAYGGSRVAVVSSSRYHPGLDEGIGIDPAHMWPASHCRSYVERVCGVVARNSDTNAENEPASLILTQQVAVEDPATTTAAAAAAAVPPPIRAAIDAAARDVHIHIPVPTSSESQEEEERLGGALWFSRLARTVAHELGHCLGMAHCVYYACSMQGTAGMAEDVRQPPYLCPVCLSKLAHAVSGELLHREGGGNDDDEGRRTEAYVRERYERIAGFCDGWKGNNGLFAGYGAWVRARLDLLR